MHRQRQRHDGDVLALARNGRLADRHDVAHLRHRVDRAGVLGHPGQAHDALVEQVHHRVVVPDRRRHQALGVGWVARYDDLHAGKVGEGAPEALRVLGSVGVPAADGRGQDHGDLDVAAGLVVDLGHVVVDLVEADAEEVGEHQLDDGTHALGRRADAEADEGRLRDRRVEDPIRPEPVEQPGRGAEDPAVGADVLAEIDDGRITLHLLGDGLDHGLGGAETAARRRRRTWGCQ